MSQMQRTLAPKSPIRKGKDTSSKHEALLKEYIEHYDNKEIPDRELRCWLETKWIPKVRKALMQEVSDAGK